MIPNTPIVAPTSNLQALYNGLDTLLKPEGISATISYYVRLVSWVGLLFAIVTSIEYIPQKTISAMKAVVCFAILLFTLIILKRRFPTLYETVRWFCTPGNMFLKSWISLFFYVYLVRVPYDLSPIDGPQIVSWIFQCVFGDFIALFISGSTFSLAFFFVRLVYHRPLDIDEFDAVEEIRKSHIEKIDSLFRQTENDHAVSSDIELFGVTNDRESNHRKVGEPVANPMTSFRPISPSISTTVVKHETLSEKAQKRISYSGPMGKSLITSSRETTSTSSTDEDKVTELPDIKAKRKSLPMPVSKRDPPTTSAPTHRAPSPTNRTNSIELNSALRDLGVSFSVIQNIAHHRPSRLTISADESDILTIERASCIKCEVRVKRPPSSTIQASTSSTLPLTVNIQPFTPAATLSSETTATAATTSTMRLTVDPFVPNMMQLLVFWAVMSILTAFILFIASVSSSSNTQHYVITFQFCVTIAVFIGSSVFRAHLIQKQFKVLVVICQSVIVFFPVVLFLVLASSIQGFNDWQGSLAQYLTSNSIQDFHTWGAGDLLVMLLASAISSLSFSTVDALMQYHRLLALIIPTIWISCILIILQGAFLSWVLESPSQTGLSLLTRTVTTPVAVAIADITGASPSITAASTIINGITSYICAPYILTFYGILNPVSRGSAAAVSGTLLGVLAVDENGEKIAAGIGMACYGIATIAYAVTMAIDGFREFVVYVQ